MVHPYLKRRQGREPVVYAHPALEPVLKRTLGVPLFQEQLLRMAMICAGFSGGEAEELRRAMGFKRSEARMREIEVKLRRGLELNGITGKAQDGIVQSIASFALYGFPESHAASFALIAYASAYLKCHYLAAFTAAILNNQPMGFYQPFTIIKDAQRHGLKVKPVDVTRSDWLCTIEEAGVGCRVSGVSEEARVDSYDEADPSFSPRHPTPDTRHLVLRLGLRYVKSLSEQSGRAIVREREKQSFLGIDDLQNRVPELRKDELRKLAAVGALNFIQDAQRDQKANRPEGPAVSSPAREGGDHGRNNREARSADMASSSAICRTFDAQNQNPGDEPRPNGHDYYLSPLRGSIENQVHRRDALWQVERVLRSAGPLYEELHEADGNSPLAPMTLPERMDADFRGTGLTIGRHPVAHYREELNKLGALRAIDIRSMQNGRSVRVAGWVIVRQRPGTAKGFVFLTLEDETGVANVIVTPQLFNKNRLVLVDHPFLLIEGTLQNQDNVVSVKARRVRALSFKVAAAPSHDFH